MHATSYAIQAKSLTKRYGKTLALDEVDLRVRAGTILGLLITMAGPDTKHGAALCERLRAEYRERVFHTEIATSRALQEAPGTSETIFQHAPRSRAADSFRRLAGEVLERLRTARP